MTFVLLPCGQFHLVGLALLQPLLAPPLFEAPIVSEIVIHSAHLVETHSFLELLSWMGTIGLAIVLQTYRGSSSHHSCQATTHGHQFGAEYSLVAIEQL